MSNKQIFAIFIFLTTVRPCVPAAADDSARNPQGPIRVSENGHGFEFRGKPILLVGDSITQGWMELGTDFDQHAYLQALGRRGINAVLLWSYIGVVDQVGDPRIGYDAPELWPWSKREGRFDLQRFNDAYFDRLREFVRLADEHDIVVVVTVHDGWTKTRFSGHPCHQANGGPLSDRRQFVELHSPGTEMPEPMVSNWSRRQMHQFYLERFCDRLLQATADQPNVMYEMFNEGEWYDQKHLRAFQLHFLQFFRARTSLPLMINDDHVGGSDFRGEPGADVISLHIPRWDDCPPARTFFEHFQTQYAGLPAKPVFFSEPVPEYDGDESRHMGIVRFLWGSLIGGAGVVVQNDASFGFASRAAIASRGANRDAVLDLEGHAARFFNDGRVNFPAMRPEGRLSSTGICLADPGKEYLIYAPAGQPFTVDLTGASGTTLFSRWYDPIRDAAEAGDAIVGGRLNQSFQPPSAHDAILHLSRVRPE